MRLKPLRVARADEDEGPAEVVEGWQADPDGRYEARYFSRGLATNRVRHGNRFSWDPPAGQEPGVVADTHPPGAEMVADMTVESAEGGQAQVADGTPRPSPAVPAAADQAEGQVGETGTSTESGVPPAWYPDPTDRAWMRYWDGVRWTDAVVPMPPASPPVDGSDDSDDSDGSTGRAAGTTALAPAAVPPPPPPAAPAGAHYVLRPGPGDGSVGALTPQGVALVTGEVPPEYDRVLVECRDGKVVEATVLTTAAVPDASVFVALVGAPAARILASRIGGIHGIFLDVGGPVGATVASPSPDQSLRLRPLA